MKRKQAVIGAEVYAEDGIRYRYIIKSLPDEDGYVQVESTHKHQPDMFHLDELHLYDVDNLKKIGADLQSKVDAAKNAFEMAFIEFQQVRDVDGMDNVSIYDLEIEGFLSLKELKTTIEKGGWSSSSLWC